MYDNEQIKEYAKIAIRNIAIDIVESFSREGDQGLKDAVEFIVNMIYLERQQVQGFFQDEFGDNDSYKFTQKNLDIFSCIVNNSFEQLERNLSDLQSQFSNNRYINFYNNLSQFVNYSWSFDLSQLKQEFADCLLDLLHNNYPYVTQMVLAEFFQQKQQGQTLMMT